MTTKAIQMNMCQDVIRGKSDNSERITFTRHRKLPAATDVLMVREVTFQVVTFRTEPAPVEVDPGVLRLMIFQ